MNIAELKELALLIKQETVEEANSSLRIGTAFEEVVKKLGLKADQTELEQLFNKNYLSHGPMENTLIRVGLG